MHLLLFLVLLQEAPTMSTEKRIQVLNQFVVDLTENKQGCGVKISAYKAVTTGGATSLVAWLTNKNPKLQVLASVGTAAGVTSVLSELFEGKRTDCLRASLVELSKKKNGEYYDELVETSLKGLAK
jgi:hypothetical protein